MMVMPRVSAIRMVRPSPLRMDLTTRSHMNHGHGGGGGGGVGLKRADNASMMMMMGMPSGPRSPLALGLEASEAAQHILRLLESSYLMMGYSSYGLEGVWHPAGLRWVRRPTDGAWTHLHSHGTGDTVHANRPSTTTSTTTTPREPPRLLSLQFADAHTALVHVKGIGGEHALLSLLRLTSQMGQADNSALYNGWRIIRSVESTLSSSSSSPESTATSSSTSTATTTKAATTAATVAAATVYAGIEQLVQMYFQVEHGGGAADAAIAQNLFASDPSTSLLTVGIAAPVMVDNDNDDNNDPPSLATDWSAPAGSLLEIPLATYLHGVRTQTPHGRAAWSRDEIMAIRVLPCQTAAAVELRVGNSSADTVFHDHLLLGKQQPPMNHHGDDDRSSSLSSSWKILSKIFSVQKW
jgi:hypothetical protein